MLFAEDEVGVGREIVLWYCPTAPTVLMFVFDDCGAKTCVFWQELPEAVVWMHPNLCMSMFGEDLNRQLDFHERNSFATLLNLN